MGDAVFGILIGWYIMSIVQILLAYGTTYRAITKEEGNNGVTLFFWLLVYTLAGLIPFLGIYLYYKSKKWETFSDQELVCEKYFDGKMETLAVVSKNGRQIQFEDGEVAEVFEGVTGYYIVAFNREYYYDSYESAVNASYIYEKTNKVSIFGLKM